MVVPFVGTLEPLHVGVDWISATATGFYDRRDLQRAAEYVLADEEAAGGERRVWKWRGYEGFECGQARWGEREDSLYCQLSGHASSLSWGTLLHHRVNVTRFDLQVTVKDAPLWCDLAEQQFRELESDRERQRSAGTYSWYVTRPHGSTLYIGAPESDVRLRLYDKAAESGGRYPAGSWRYEVQARNGVAGTLAADLDYRSGSAIPGDGAVYQRFASRGCRPAFRPSGARLLGVVPRPATDAERTLRWLDTQVRPAINRLTLHGRGDDARRALGHDVDGGE